MSESLIIPNGFEHGSIVSERNSWSFCVLPHNLFEQAFEDSEAMVGIVDDEKFAGRSLLFVSSILSGKYDSQRGQSPQVAALENFVSDNS